MVLAFIHQKGGTGKSTLAIATAIWLAKRGRKVLLLDVDTQGTSSNWGRRYGKKFGVEALAQHARLVAKDVAEYREEYEDLILDLPPTVTAQTEKAIEVADALIIPTRPSQSDIWALDRLIALILVSERKPAPPYFVVFNQSEPDDIMDFKGQLSMRRVPYSETCVPLSKDWTKIYLGNELTDEMDRIIGSILHDIPAENSFYPM